VLLNLRPRDLIVTALIAAIWVTALVRTSSKVAPARALPATRRAAVAQSIASAEPSARARARRQFPFDNWSQDDAFHNSEQGSVRALAAREHADLGSVLSALDAYLRAHPSPTRKTGASPCKPRPFYD
jgi:hypothetical protein